MIGLICWMNEVSKVGKTETKAARPARKVFRAVTTFKVIDNATGETLQRNVTREQAERFVTAFPGLCEEVTIVRG